MYCSECGKELPAHVTTCPACGCSTAAATPSSAGLSTTAPFSPTEETVASSLPAGDEVIGETPGEPAEAPPPEAVTERPKPAPEPDT